MWLYVNIATILIFYDFVRTTNAQLCKTSAWKSGLYWLFAPRPSNKYYYFSTIDINNFTKLIQIVLYSSHGGFVQSIFSLNYACSNSIEIFLLGTKLIYICFFYGKQNDEYWWQIYFKNSVFKSKEVSRLQ